MNATLRAALSQLRRELFDLVFLDAKLPAMVLHLPWMELHPPQMVLDLPGMDVHLRLTGAHRS